MMDQKESTHLWLVLVMQPDIRENAAEARKQAEKCVSAVDKESWLKMAEDWLKLAQSSEGRK